MGKVNEERKNKRPQKFAEKQIEKIWKEMERVEKEIERASDRDKIIGKWARSC